VLGGQEYLSMDFGSVNGGGASIHFYVFREDAYGTGKPFMCFGCLGVDSCHSGIHSLDEYLCVCQCVLQVYVSLTVYVRICICSDLQYIILECCACVSVKKSILDPCEMTVQFMCV